MRPTRSPGLSIPIPIKRQTDHCLEPNRYFVVISPRGSHANEAAPLSGADLPPHLALLIYRRSGSAPRMYRQRLIGW